MEWQLIFEGQIDRASPLSIEEASCIIIEASTNGIEKFVGMIFPTFSTPSGETECKGIAVRNRRREFIFFSHPIPTPYTLRFQPNVSCNLKIWKPLEPITKMATTNPIVFPEYPKSESSNVSTVNPSLESQIALDPNPDRKGATFKNNSTGVCYIACFVVANSANHLSALEPGGTFDLEPTNYVGNISVIWPAEATGSLSVTEFV